MKRLISATFLFAAINSYAVMTPISFKNADKMAGELHLNYRQCVSNFNCQERQLILNQLSIKTFEYPMGGENQYVQINTATFNGGFKQVFPTGSCSTKATIPTTFMLEYTAKPTQKITCSVVPTK